MGVHLLCDRLLGEGTVEQNLARLTVGRQIRGDGLEDLVAARCDYQGARLPPGFVDLTAVLGYLGPPRQVAEAVGGEGC